MMTEEEEEETGPGKHGRREIIPAMPDISGPLGISSNQFAASILTCERPVYSLLDPIIILFILQSVRGQVNWCTLYNIRTSQRANILVLVVFLKPFDTRLPTQETGLSKTPGGLEYEEHIMTQQPQGQWKARKYVTYYVALTKKQEQIRSIQNEARGKKYVQPSS